MPRREGSCSTNWSLDKCRAGPKTTNREAKGIDRKVPRIALQEQTQQSVSVNARPRDYSRAIGAWLQPDGLMGG